MKLTIKQISDKTGKDWTTILGWIKRYGLKAEKEYKNFRWLVDESDLEKFLANFNTRDQNKKTSK